MDDVTQRLRLKQDHAYRMRLLDVRQAQDRRRQVLALVRWIVVLVVFLAVLRGHLDSAILPQLLGGAAGR